MTQHSSTNHITPLMHHQFITLHLNVCHASYFNFKNFDKNKCRRNRVIFNTDMRLYIEKPLQRYSAGVRSTQRFHSAWRDYAHEALTFWGHTFGICYMCRQFDVPGNLRYEHTGELLIQNQWNVLCFLDELLYEKCVHHYMPMIIPIVPSFVHVL